MTRRASLLFVVLLTISGCGGYSTSKSNTRETSRCDPSYPTVCIPAPPPKLNCSDIKERNFKVTGRDPQGFDKDGDGKGCEQ